MKRLIVACAFLGFAFGFLTPAHRGPTDLVPEAAAAIVFKPNSVCPGGGYPMCVRCHPRGGCALACYGDLVCYNFPDMCVTDVSCMSF